MGQLAEVADRRQRFGRIVKERREELGLTQYDVAAMGGASDATQSRIENPTEGSPTPSITTRNSYDDILQWKPGSAARVWAGGDPVKLEDMQVADSSGEPSKTPPSMLAAPELGPDEVPVSLEMLTGLLRTATQLRQALDSATDDSRLREEVTTAALQLQRTVSLITGTWVTEMLERNSAAGQVHPIIEFAFGEHLAVPVNPKDPDADEKLYRRWLAGRGDDLPRAKHKQFEARLARKRLR